MDKLTESINRTIEDIWILYEQKEKEYTNFQLNNQQYVILTLIIRNETATPSELAKKMNVTKSAISQHLTRLEASNYITRKQDAKDKRAYTIYLAEKGELFKKEMDHLNTRLAQKYSEHLSIEELNHMLTSLQKLKKIVGQI